MKKTQWWLAELDQYGNPTLVDGAHGERSGVEQALHLYGALGLRKGVRYACAEVRLSDVKPNGDGVNQEAVENCQKMLKRGN